MKFRLPPILRQHDGPLTRELVQAPARFGLGRVPLAQAPDATATAVCGFCSTGCGLRVHLRDGHAVSLTPDASYPVNHGMACPKGWEALAVLDAPDRATTPLLRGPGGTLAPAGWDAALRAFVDGFKSIQERHGPDALAWLGTGQIVTEELALLGTVAKFGMGIRHGDGNTRQCMATAATAYKESFGFDAPPFTYADFEQSDVIVLIGSNLCIAHPILWERICRSRRNPEIIAIDPRRTETAAAATHHVPIRPKSDLVLFYGLAHLLIAGGRVDRAFVAAHTRGFDEFAAFVADFPPDRVARDTGIDPPALAALARTLGDPARRVSYWWTMGVNQSYEGTRVAQAVINLALLTGNVGKPGTGANSVTGQCNAMGSRLFSNTTTLLGGRDCTKPGDRQAVAGVLGIDAARIPATNSLAYHEIIDAVDRGQIKGLWVIATNTAHSWIGKSRLADVLGKLELLVVQDMYHSTDTARLAHVVLPAAGWGEKDGTFINSERRIGLTRKVRRAPGQALSDFAIVKLVADYWGCDDLLAGWESPAEAFQTLKALSRGQPCDFSGIADYAMLDRCGGVQWPWPARDDGEAPDQERRLFADGRFFHPDGKARFVFEAPRPMPEPPSDAYPFLLLTGRGSAAQWHTGTRTDKSAVLRKLYPAALHLELNPADADRVGVRTGDAVTVASRRGELEARAFVTAAVRPGQVFLPMHHAATNRLTDPVFDPYSKQPSYKACAVAVRKAGARPAGGAT